MPSPLLVRALLALNLGYCLVVSFARVPAAWGMFQRVEPLDFTLLDNAGRPVDVYKHTTRSLYIVDRHQLAEIVEFICRSRPDLAPLAFEERHSGSRLELHAPDCRVSLAR